MSNHIPQSFIDELLARVDIVSIIEPFVALRKTGANYKGLCPFHQEKTPSFTVNADKQFFHCFGCGISGNAISFLMKYENQDFIEIIENLASLASMQIPNEILSPALLQKSKTLYDIMEQANTFYQQQLRQCPQAINYLKQRGLSGDIAKKFGIGYSPSGWDNLLKTIGRNNEQREQLLATGMLIQKTETSYYDRFRNRIMFPIRDRRGRVIGFGGRVLNDETPKYLNSPETQIFHKGSELYGLFEARKANRQLQRLLIVEGYTDVIALAQNGITYAVATLGTAITANHVQYIFRICKEIVFCFDGDRAGQEAAWRAMEILILIVRDDWKIYFMFLPEGEDPDSMIRTERSEKFEARIQKSSTLSEFFFRHLKNQINLSQPDGRARFISLAMNHIQKMPNNIMREVFVETLSEQTQIHSDKLIQRLPKSSQTPIPTETKISLIHKAIMLLIQNPPLIKHIDFDLTSLPTGNTDLLAELANRLKTNPTLSTGAIMEHWRNKPEETLLIKLAGQEHIVPSSGLISEFCAIMKKLRQHGLEYRIEQLMNKAVFEGLNNSEKKILQNLLLEKQNS